MPYIRVPKLSGSHPLVMAEAVQVRLFWDWGTVSGCNVLAGRVGGGYVNSQTHADNLGTAILASFISSGLQALLHTSVLFGGIGIRDIRTPHQVEYVTDGISGNGTGTGDRLPRQVTACVTLRTALAGKSYRGRTYISGANEAQNASDGTMDPAFGAACVAFLEAVQTDMAAEGITLAVLSAPRFANLTPPLDVATWPGALTNVSAIQLRDYYWDSQERRKF